MNTTSRTTGSCATPGEPACDMSQSMLMEISRTIPRIEAEVTHIAHTVDATRKKVDDLTTWKNRIVGGVAVTAFLWATLWASAKMLSEHVHITIGNVPSAMTTTSPR